MTDEPTFHGALQAEVMQAVWTSDGGTVQEIRRALPSSSDHAYNTIQTVLNRLVERGLLERERRGVAYVYRPTLAEPEYVSRAIGRVLSDASPSARQAALAELIGSLEPRDIKALEALSRAVGDRRKAAKRKEPRS